VIALRSHSVAGCCLTQNTAHCASGEYAVECGLIAVRQHLYPQILQTASETKVYAIMRKTHSVTDCTAMHYRTVNVKKIAFFHCVDGAYG
jgi:hypothetical protein